jgi:hypothetical protein
MGTSLRHRGAGLWEARTSWGWNVVFLFAVLVTSMMHQAHAQPVDEDVSKSVEQLNALIFEMKSGSVFYRRLGKLSGAEFGVPSIHWRRAGKGHSSPYNELFRRVISLSVCNEEPRALTALFETNEVISGGLFDEFESEVLHWVAEQQQLPLDFRGSLRKNYPPFRNDDIKTIRTRHAIQRALSEKRKSEALKLVRSFRELCGPSNE